MFKASILLRLTALVAGLVIFAGCEGGEFAANSLQDFPQMDLETPPGDDQDQNEDQDQDQDENWDGLNICSDLEFDGLDWAPSLRVAHREPFALALNITGSFEGNDGWQNLGGNGDGQGISMGLLQWNLGQGTLQPIWNEMFYRYQSQFTNEFTGSQISSIRGMLDAWNSYANSSTLDLSDYGYNELDDPEIVARDLGVPVEEILTVNAALNRREQESVNWAKANVLSGTSVKSDWSRRLKNVAVTQGYRSLQAEKAESRHKSAMNLFNIYEMSELRSYLVFFDIVVQNGSIPSDVYNDYQSWLRSNRGATEYTKMKKLIELRVAKVSSRWRADVMARKMTILDGTGTVHMSERDLNEEYCTNIRVPMPN